MGGGCSRAGISRTWPEELHGKELDAQKIFLEHGSGKAVPSPASQRKSRTRSSEFGRLLAHGAKQAGSTEVAGNADAPRRVTTLLDGLSRVSSKGLLRGQTDRSPGRHPPSIDAMLAKQMNASDPVEPIDGATEDEIPAAVASIALTEWKQAELKVRELSQRGFGLPPVLDFYSSLGTPHLMAHFHPDLSTTRDVVWGAVLPRSSNARCALATLFQDGWPTRPTRFIAHAWDASFSDTVAALVADALGLPTSADIKGLLVQGGAARIRRQALVTGVHNARTYWMCVFSVNQHRALCGASSVPQGKDTVTGKRYRVCPCGGQKYSEGAFCEADKFHLVMSELNSPGFRFVMAVDQKCRTLTRAWCMLELVEADTLSIPVDIQVGPFADVKTDLILHMRNLDVNNCAACKEDIAFLFSRIPKVDRFNAELRRLLMSDSEGVISRWIARAFKVWRLFEAWRRVHISTLIDMGRELANDPTSSPARNRMSRDFPDSFHRYVTPNAEIAPSPASQAGKAEHHSLQHWAEHSRASALVAEDKVPEASLLVPDDLHYAVASSNEGVYYTEVDPTASVSINVGGRRFLTVLSTLRSIPHSLLTQMFSGRVPLIRDEDGCYCIDRDGRYFHVILNYLRDRSLPLSLSESERWEVVREAKFYGLTALVEGLRGMWRWDRRLVAKQLVSRETPPEDMLPPERDIKLYARLRYGYEYAGSWIVSSPRGLPAVEYEFHQGCVAKDPIAALSKMANAGFTPCAYPPPIPRPQDYYKDTWEIMLQKEMPQSMLCA
mmetsp:Transcript_1374/g.3696  ORF Transcript_1374/g.3696 Transcript_1374/m.3696 type:complete len:780 (+) Transcript_1374:70-2409(+)